MDVLEESGTLGTFCASIWFLVVMYYHFQELYSIWMIKKNELMLNEWVSCWMGHYCCDWSLFTVWSLQIPNEFDLNFISYFSWIFHILDNWLSAVKNVLLVFCTGENSGLCTFSNNDTSGEGCYIQYWVTSDFDWCLTFIFFPLIRLSESAN